MIIEAVFIGQPSLGYKRLKKYRLETLFGADMANPAESVTLSIYRLNNNKREEDSFYPYESVEAFFKNWTAIKTDYL